MRFRFCDDLGADGFGWIVDEAMTRTSHALAADGKVWLVDALDWPEAIDRALALGEPAGVIQLLDRHDRDCAALASRLGVPHVVAPDELAGKPVHVHPGHAAEALARVGALVAGRRGRSSRPTRSERTAFYTGGKAPIGVHLLAAARRRRGRSARSSPSTSSSATARECTAPDGREPLRDALRTSRRRLPGVLLRLPFAGRR